MSAFRRALEDFGDPGRGRKSEVERRIEAEAAKARGEGRAEGYAEGYAAAAAEAETEDRAAVAALIEAARDLALDRAAAQAEAVAAFAPVARALARLAAPRAAEAGLAQELAAAVSERLEAAPGETLTAHVAPERVAALAALLGDAVAVRADAALSPCDARLDWSGGGARFDAEACVAAAIGAIDRFFGDGAADALTEETRDVG